MKRILYVGNKLSGFGYTPTGVEFLGQLLESCGFQVHYAGAKNSKALRLLEMMYFVLRRNRYDIILIDMYSTLAFYYCLIVVWLAKIVRRPYVPILRGGNLPERLKGSPALMMQIIKPAYRVVAVSHYLQYEFSKLRSIDYIPNFIDLSKYPYKQRATIKPRLLWVRSLHKIYNPELAVRIVVQLKEIYPEVRVTMVGPDKDGSKARVEQLAAALGVADQVLITGKLSKAAWIELASSHDIFINTTNFDNMPVSVVEAMALGLPIVTTNVGGIPYLLEDRKDGMLVLPDDANGFCLAIQTLLNDPGLVSTLTAAAKIKIQQFDEAMVRPKWRDLLV